jgi:ABC-type polysaccharide/polyol phosphate transport system ATPase subunit
MSNDVVIRIEGLWKKYGLPMPAFLQKTWNLFRKGKIESPENGDEGLWALRDINLEIGRGEIIGIVGRNGAGKSTLLKVLAGVTEPTRGRVEIRGRIFPMIELNAGLHMELTGRENVRLLGAVMGLSNSEIEARLPEIEDFTELDEWFDKPVRMYSSGMLGRLGFGVAVSVRSDVTLIDETFAVGDLRFQNKSLARVKQMREGGATVLLVSHSLETLQFVTHKGILLEQGNLIVTGTSLEAVTAYERLVFRSEQGRLERGIRRRAQSDGITIHNCRLYDANGESLTEVLAGEPFGIEVDLSLEDKPNRPEFALGIVNAAGILCKWDVSGEACLSFGDGDRTVVRAWYKENHLSTGAYEVQLMVGNAGDFQDARRKAPILSFAMTGSRRARGIVAGRCQWDLVPHPIHSSCAQDGAPGE